MIYVLFAAERNTHELPAYGPFVSTELRQGLYSGHGHPDVLLCYKDPLFYVAAIQDVDVIKTSDVGNCDFFRGDILIRGNLPHITYWLQTKGGDIWRKHPLFGTSSYAYGAHRSAEAGHYGVAVGAGACGYTVAALDYGVAVSQAADSTAISGYSGTSITGVRGMSISGKHGVAIAGPGGSVRAGLRGTLVLGYTVFGQVDKASVSVDGESILANKLYHVNDMAEFVLACDALQRKADTYYKTNKLRGDL